MLLIRKVVLLVSLIVGISLPAFTQWYNQVSGTTDNLYAVRFASKDTGIVVGGNLNQSSILRTVNGGISWESQTFSSSKWLYALEYLENGIFVAAGYNGLMFKSLDYGSTWSPRSSGTTEWIYDLHFPHPDTGYAVGLNGIILRSVNGGDNWSNLGYQAPVTLLDVNFHTPHLGMSVGIDGRIFKTTDAGSSWEEMNNDDNRTLTSVYMINSDTIITCGFEGLILRSKDGGQIWNPVISGTSYNLQDMAWAENGVLYSVGYGSIIRSEDVGSSWATMNYPVTTHLTAVEVVDVGTAFAVGLSGTILKNNLSLHNQLINSTRGIIYPNPACHELAITIPIEIQIEALRVSDARGVFVLNQKVSTTENYSLSLESLGPGMYFVHLTGPEYSFVHPLIIIR